MGEPWGVVVVVMVVGGTDALIFQQGFSCGGLVAVLCPAGGGGLSGESCRCVSVGNRSDALLQSRCCLSL